MKKSDFLNLRPMLLEEIPKPFNSKDYLFEIKFDGFRSLIYLDKKTIIVLSRNGLILNDIFPELLSLKSLIKEPCILDGEIIYWDNAKPNFKVLQERLSLKNKNKIALLSENMPVTFMAFDILEYQNKDLTNMPLIERKKILDTFPENNLFKISKYFLEKGCELFKVIKKMDLEGIVAKKIMSSYTYEKRSNNWIKIKNWQADYFYIGGFSLNKNNTLSLYLGKKENKNLFFVGKISISSRHELYQKILKKKVIKKSPFINYSDSNCYYLKPAEEIYVYYTAITKNKKLRHPKL